MICSLLNRKKKKTATLLGFVAIFIWAIEVVIVSELNEMPLFEALFIIFISSFLFTAARITYSKKWVIYKNHSYKIWLMGVIGVCGSDAAYMFAALKAPIIHVDLIDYIWPCLSTFFVSLLPGERFRFKNIIACLLGLIGVIMLFGDSNLTDQYEQTYVIGYWFAFFGALLWAVYIAFSRFMKEVPSEMVGLYCGIGALAALLCHLSFEVFVIPTNLELCLCVIMGFSGGGLAYQLWDLGIKFGDLPLLNTSTYFARVLAMILLAYLEKSIITYTLMFSTIITILAVILSSEDVSNIKKNYIKTKKI